MKQNNKMYWKDGFYDTYEEGRIEISEEYWQQLLEEQSNGKKIISNEEGYPIAVNRIESVEDIKAKVLARIRTFDKSEEINSFSLRGDNIWLDKDLRSSIANTVAIKLKKGITKSSIWYNNKEYVLKCEDIISMLEDVSIYADACNSIKQRHISNIYTMDNIEDIENYNYKNNYPTKLRFDYHEESIL